jgi:uncharacterized membrane protein YciS (DUF1049 family)
MNHLDEYNNRKYVRGINWGFLLSAAGFAGISTLGMIAAMVIGIGLIIGIFSSIIHLIDSRRRIKTLKKKLAALNQKSKR